MTELFRDEFNRSDESLDAGANWTERHAGSGDFAIVSNQVQLGGSGSALTLGHTSSSIPTSADYKAYATCNYEGSGPNGVYLGVAIRRVDYSTSDSDLYAAFLRAGGGGQALLFKRVSGSWTQIDSDSTITVSGSTDYIVTTEANGTTISGDIDGSYNLSATDSDISAAGDAGITTGTGFSGTGNTWDTFVIEDFLTPGVGIEIFRRRIEGY